MDHYREKIEESRREQAERQKAIDRDAKPYDPKEMRSGMPCGCTMALGFAFSALLVLGVWFLVKFVRGG